MSKYNDISCCGLVVDTDTRLCNRAKLDTGTFCNYRCSFCYYRDNLGDMGSFEDIKHRIDYLRKCGIKEVDLSGGESSIHPKWFDILDYCDGLYISTLTNGYKFSDIEFMSKSKEHGLREILFSVHGYDNDSHDKIVGFVGAFDRIIQSIKNAHKLGIKVRVNCTVSNYNYTSLSTSYVKLLLEINPIEINFIPLNYWGDNKEGEKIDYVEVSKEIKRTIDLIDIKYINVRYIPYCFMVGYERYVCDYYQHIYDIYDWNIALCDYDVDPEIFQKNQHDIMYETAKDHRLFQYKKKFECVKCKYFYICDGIEYDMPVFPEVDERITNPVHYRKNFYAND